jgi:hypothetical protein
MVLASKLRPPPNFLFCLRDEKLARDDMRSSSHDELELLLSLHCIGDMEWKSNHSV